MDPLERPVYVLLEPGIIKATPSIFFFFFIFSRDENYQFFRVFVSLTLTITSDVRCFNFRRRRRLEKRPNSGGWVQSYFLLLPLLPPRERKFRRRRTKENKDHQLVVSKQERNIRPLVANLAFQKRQNSKKK